MYECVCVCTLENNLNIVLVSTSSSSIWYLARKVECFCGLFSFPLSYYIKLSSFLFQVLYLDYFARWPELFEKKSLERFVSSGGGAPDGYEELRMKIQDQVESNREQSNNKMLL